MSRTVSSRFQVLRMADAYLVWNIPYSMEIARFARTDPEADQNAEEYCGKLT